MNAAVALSFFFALITLTRAELKWDQPEQSFTAKPTERTVVAKYRFTNTGTNPVTIDSVHTSCGCTTATLAKKEYLPGESGEIEARFDVAGRIGHQEKVILVTTNEAAKPSMALRLIVELPQALTIQPQMVFWRLGETPAPKTIEVSVAADSPANIVSVVSDTPSVTATVEQALPGKKATIRVTPANTIHAESATVLIKTDYPADNPEAHYAYVRIK